MFYRKGSSHSHRAPAFAGMTYKKNTTALRHLSSPPLDWGEGLTHECTFHIFLSSFEEERLGEEVSDNKKPLSN